MKTFNSFMWILGISYHIWTAVIAFKHGLVAGIITVLLPAVSEIYWFFKMWGENTPYIIVSVVFVVCGIVYKIIDNGRL